MRDRLVTTGAPGALQQEFYWSFVLLSGWACIVLFNVIEFENLRAIFAFQRLGELGSKIIFRLGFPNCA
jgi:hypothetical protein